MKRKIKFRAKNKITNEWVYGWLFIDISEKDAGELYYYIIDEKAEYIGITETIECNNNRIYEVNPNTICQFTNFYDKNNKEIYEKDIIKFKDKLYVVYWSGICWQVEPINHNKTIEITELPLFFIKSEIVGNIFDNKNLIE